ncbi:NADH dehydrogenase [ubiquinone] flavoprotein 1 [Psidium guajava]|nr:NADH dehydrogenase [ubiquinone] flavoprotein 1 [Psidium guajava]
MQHSQIHAPLCIFSFRTKTQENTRKWKKKAGVKFPFRFQIFPGKSKRRQNKIVQQTVTPTGRVRSNSETTLSLSRTHSSIEMNTPPPPRSSPPASPSQFVPLPLSVEDAVRRICIDQKQPPPNASTRRKLASLGEEAALRVLRSTAATKIKWSINGLISHIIENGTGSGSSPSPSPSKTARVSLNDQSPARSPTMNSRGQ